MCPATSLYPTRRVELEVPNKLDLKGTQAAKRVLERLEGVEELALEVSEKVGGDWTEFLRMDSLKGLTSLHFAHLEAGLHSIPANLPALSFRLTSLVLAYPTTSSVISWILPTLTPHLRHLAINLLLPPNVGKHTALPLLELVAPQLHSLRIVHLKDQDEPDWFDVRPFLGLSNLRKVGLSADIGAATGAAEYDTLMRAISPTVRILRVARGFPLDLLAEWLHGREMLQEIEVEQSRWIDEDGLAALRTVCDQRGVQLRLPG